MSSQSMNVNKVTIAGAVGAIGASLIIRYLVKRYLYWNREFVKAGKVESLYVFPVKSCKGIKVPHLECGLKGGNVGSYGENIDRRFLLVDSTHNNILMTARTHPQMVLIEVNVKNSVLTVTLPDGKSGTVDLNKVVARNDVRKALLHRNKRTDGYDCGDEIAAFFAKFLEVGDKRAPRLLYFDEKLYNERNFQSQSNYWNNPVPKVNESISYQDLASYLAFSSASVDDLNSRLAEQDVTIDLRNFRPNLVISGVGAYDEDRWLHVRIGEVEFVCYKPCTRCILTTVDPDSGKKNEKTEPLKELRRYRLAPKGKILDEFGDRPIFGVNMNILRRGVIHVGDDVYIRYKPTPF